MISSGPKVEPAGASLLEVGEGLRIGLMFHATDNGNLWRPDDLKLGTRPLYLMGAEVYLFQIEGQVTLEEWGLRA